VEFDILIATDVLYLQDAAYLIDYDLHWNPTRMIQRARRIDRLGSPHDVITNELLRQQLLVYLRDHGRALIDELPDGIHSCLRRDGRRGIFACYRHADRHFWRFWDEWAGFISDNRFEIHEIIRTTPATPRDEEWIAAERQEEALEAIAADILPTIAREGERFTESGSRSAYTGVCW
jgi:hypothetical protein